MKNKANSFCGKMKAEAIVAVPKPWHILCLILNILISGSGTILSAFLGKEFNMCVLIVGLIQLFFVWTFVCWIWSIIWGILIFMKSEGN